MQILKTRPCGSRKSAYNADQWFHRPGLCNYYHVSTASLDFPRKEVIRERKKKKSSRKGKNLTTMASAFLFPSMEIEFDQFLSL